MDEKLAWMEKKDKSRIEKEKEEEKRNEQQQNKLLKLNVI